MISVFCGGDNLKRQLALFDMIGNVMSIIAGALLILGAFMPWVGMALKGMSVGGKKIADGEKTVINLFQFTNDGHVILKIAGGIIVAAGITLLVFGLFSMLEKRLIHLAFIKLAASGGGLVGIMIALTSSSIKKENEMVKELLTAVPDLAVKLTPWGKILSIIAVIVMIIADVFCAICMMKRQSLKNRRR